MFTEDEMNYRFQVAMAVGKDAVVRKLSSEVQHLLVPFEALMAEDIRERVKQALAK